MRPEQHAPDAVQWHWLDFEALGVARLYALLRLRSAVFVVEQRCLFQDMDDLDAQALHVVGLRPQGDSTELVACARCFPPGVAFAEASIGRVAVRADARGTGLAHALVTQAVSALESQWGAQPIRIGAQAHLAGFYAQHGFVDVGRPYVEDGIPHLEMLRSV